MRAQTLEAQGADLTGLESGGGLRFWGLFSRGSAALLRVSLLLLAAVLIVPSAHADEYRDTVRLFRNAGQSARFFRHCYAYAVFPTIAKGGFFVGAAHGDGRVYSRGRYLGDTSMTQLSVGFQAGGQAYSEIIFFQNRDAFNEFAGGSFELGADVSAVVITAAATGEAATSGATGGISGGMKDAETAGGYYKGLAVFTIVKGGVMLQAAVAGQKFTYKPRAD